MEHTAFERATQQPAETNFLAIIRHSRWAGPVMTAVITAVIGFVTALIMPRGPATAEQALVVMTAAFLIGLLGGLVVRSRWVVLLAAVVYIAAVELGRLDAAGPTVDAIRFDNTFGILAFILGRGFHGLLAFLPLVLGAAAGRRLAERAEGRGRPRSIVQKLPTAALAIFLMGLVILILLPANTPPIMDASGKIVPGSINELVMIPVGGTEQGLMIRGRSADNPVLLYLSGGPGQSSLPWPRVLFEELTQDFILVGWDQRGTGKSYAALDPTSELTLDQMVADTIEVTNYLRQRFDEEKIYLLGESWGTTLAVLAAQQQPDLYHAIIGSGQMVSQRETDRRLYYDVLAYAAETGNEELTAQMQAFGEPPYADMYAYAFVMGYYEALYQPYTPPAAYLERGRAAGLGPWNILGSEYDFVEKVNVFRGFLDMASVLYPQLQGIDFRQDVPRLETAVYILDGAAELAARRDLALEWYETLDAPIKRLYTYENAAHAVAFEQFEAFQQLMVDTVLPETYGGIQ